MTFIAIFVARQVSGEQGDGVALLYVLPTTLVALELGLVAALWASALSLALLGIWVLDAQVAVTGENLLAPVTGLLVVGLVAGRFGDRMRDAQMRQRLLLESGLALANLKVADDLAAKVAEQALQLPSSTGARVELTDSSCVEAGDWSEREGTESAPIEVRGVRYGTLAVSGRARPLPEDQATLATLALQAAVAAENRRLLEIERERAAIHADLAQARRGLVERGRQLSELIERQEAERHKIAYELREQAAQTLAAVLLGLGALDREADSPSIGPKLGELQSDIGSTLSSLRSLAASLRPPLELGLEAALENLGQDGPGRTIQEMRIELPRTGRLSSESETIVYRVTEEAVAAVGSAELVAVTSRADGTEILVSVKGAAHPVPEERLAVLRARLELIGGSLVATETELRAGIPVRSACARSDPGGNVASR